MYKFDIMPFSKIGDNVISDFEEVLTHQLVFQVIPTNPFLTVLSKILMLDSKFHI